MMRTYSIVVTAAALALGACADLSKPYPAKESFALASPAVTRSAATAPVVVRVERVRVADPFDARTFHYRLSETRYEADYYSEFVADPAQLLTGELVRLLGASGAFATVIEPASSAEAARRLETSVLELFADYRDAGAPRAVVRARFLLLEDARESTRVLGDWTLDAATPMAQGTPGAFAEALSRSWSDVVGQLVRALEPR